MHKKHTSVFIAFYFLFSLVFFSCGNSADQKPSSSHMNSVSGDKVDDFTQFKYDKLIGNVPIPFDIFRVHPEGFLVFDPEVMNSISALPYYTTSTQKALNLGIYGGDLAYCITYERFEEMGNYLKCAKKLADDLGIPLAFDQQALANYKKYSTNRDSLEKMVFTSYSEVDKTLKSNERIGLASLVITGGWIEGLYITLKTLGSTPKNEKTKNLYMKIWEQKNYLEMIIGILEEFKDEIAYVNMVIDLHSIKSVYDNLSNKSDINESEVAVLAPKVSEVRAKIIAP